MIQDCHFTPSPASWQEMCVCVCVCEMCVCEFLRVCVYEMRPV